MEEIIPKGTRFKLKDKMLGYPAGHIVIAGGVLGATSKINRYLVHTPSPYHNIDNYNSLWTIDKKYLKLAEIKPPEEWL